MIQRKLSTVGFFLTVLLCIAISALRPSKCYTLKSVVDQVAIKEANDGQRTNKHEITVKELTTISSKQQLEPKKETSAQLQSTTSQSNSVLSSVEPSKSVLNLTTTDTTKSELIKQQQQTYTEKSSSDQLDEFLNIDRIEYDLLEYLEKLGARYRASNKSYPFEAPSEYLYSPTSSSSSFQTSLNSTTPTIQANDGPIIVNFSSTPSSLHETISSSSSQASNLSGKDANEPETSEGSWQYGIFDRFTRARSTSTTLPPEPSPRPEDYRNFNTEECGLRYFDDYSGEASSLLKSTQLASPPAQFVGVGEDDVLGPVQGSSGSSQSPQQSPVHDNQDNLKPAREKFSHINSFGESVQKSQVNDYDSQSLSHNNWPDPHTLGLKHDWNKELFGHENAAGAANKQQQQQLNDDLNLSSRRNWRQQQIGQTLQSFGFNLTDLLTMRMNSAVSKRENLSKMSAGFVTPNQQSANQKSGKSIDDKEQQTKVINQQVDTGSHQREDLKLEARVIGGTDARLGDSPWAVSLQALVSRPGTGGVEYRHYCGGTIISDRYILTAAHCLDFMVGRESRLFVVLGDLQWRMTTSSMYGRRVPIEKLIIHAGYKSTAFGHDIGLIKTKESIQPLIVKGRYVINRVCLPEKNVEHTGDAELVGWGLFSNRNEMADSLQIANVPILPRSLCVDLYRRRTGLIQWIIGIELITDKQICASTFGRGICQGDSGSPLVYNEKLRRLPSDTTTHQSFYNEKTRATIIGIVAFGGIRRCSYQSLPGVYMQTSKYMDWILPKII